MCDHRPPIFSHQALNDDSSNNESDERLVSQLVGKLIVNKISYNRIHKEKDFARLALPSSVS